MQEFDKKEARNGKIRGYACLILAILVILLIIISICLAYVPYFNFISGDGQIRDGFGRMLDDIPPALSLILPQWAGHIWLIIDCLILLAMIVVVDKLIVKSRIYFKGVKNVDYK